MKVLSKLFAIALIVSSINIEAKEANTLASLVSLKKIDEGKVQLTYYGKTPEKVHVYIFDGENQKIFNETVKSKTGIKKPYNISTLPYGEYRFEIRVNDEVVTQNIEHSAPSYPGGAKLLANTVTDNKIRMMVVGPEYKNFKIRVFDEDNELLYQEIINQEHNYGKLVNLSDTKTESVTLVLSNKNKVLQRKVIDL